MKAQIITLSGILATASLLTAGNHAQANTGMDATSPAHSSATVGLMKHDQQHMKNPAMNTEADFHGRNDRNVGTKSQINQHDNDNIITDQAGNNYFMPTNNEMMIDQDYGRNDRSVSDDIRSSSYGDSDMLSNSLRTHVFYNETRRQTMSEMRSDVRADKNFTKAEQQVDSWRNKVRKDLDVLNNSTEESYESARGNLQKSFDGYSKANTTAINHFQMGSKRLSVSQ